MAAPREKFEHEAPPEGAFAVYFEFPYEDGDEDEDEDGGMYETPDDSAEPRRPRQVTAKYIFEELGDDFEGGGLGPGRPPFSADSGSGAFLFVAELALGALGTVALGVASSALWDLIKRVAPKLKTVLEESREEGSGVEVDSNGVLLLALEEARKKRAGFRTDPRAIRIATDGQELPQYFGPAVHVLVVPDFGNRVTHILAISERGKVVHHHVGDFLTADGEALAHDGEKAWLWSDDDEDWSF